MTHPNKGDFWQGSPKPPAEPQSDSWWTRPAAQTDRSKFSETLTAELPRINAHPRFGGARQIHDSELGR